MKKHSETGGQTPISGPAQPLKGRIAVVGAGLAGLVAGRTLVERGAEVRLFEKARGVGGRLATRRLSVDPQDSKSPSCRFDFGAQFFSAFDPRFQDQVLRWGTQGRIHPWFEKQGSPRYRAGAGGMNALAKDLAEGLDVVVQTRVTDIRAVENGQYELFGIQGGPTSLPQNPLGQGQSLGVFDGLILSAPWPQSQELLFGKTKPEASSLTFSYHPCVAWMGVFAEDAVTMNAPGFLDAPTSELQAVASSRCKGLEVVRGFDGLTVHLTPETSARFSQASDQEITEWVCEKLKELGCLRAEAQVFHFSLQRWRFSQPIECGASRWKVLPFAGANWGVGICGDFMGGPRVEGAYLSGLEMGAHYGAV